MAFFSFTRAGRSGRFRRGLGWPLLPAMLAGALVLMAAGCHKNTGDGDFPSGGSGGGDVVATVNSDSITVGQMYDYMRHLTPQQMASQPSEPIGKFALSQLIVADLVTQLAKSKSVPVTDQQVDQRYKDLEMVESWEFPMPYDQFLEAQGQTPDSLKQYGLRSQMAQFNLITRTLQVTPTEMQAYYNEHKSTYSLHKAVEVERVAVSTQAAAQTIYDQVSKGAAMSTFQSQSEFPPTPGSDPVLIPQWIVVDPPSKTLGPLEGPLGSAKAGDTLKPLKMGTAWWVVHIPAVRAATVVPYDQVQNLVRMSILQTKAGPQTAQDLVQDMQSFDKTAAITVKPPEYQDIVQQIKNPAPAPAPPTGAPGASGGPGVPPPGSAPAPAPGGP